MASNNSSPPFSGIVYRSRVNDKINLSDSDGSVTIAELDTQYKNVVEIDRIQSRTFDADSDGLVLGFTDFSNTINTMDENQWLRVDSDTYGNNILGDELDFRPERPGRENPPVYSVGITRLTADTSTAAGIIEYQYNLIGIAQANPSTLSGLGKRGQTISLASLTSTTSSVSGIGKRTIKSIDGTTLAATSSVVGTAERTIKNLPFSPPAIICGDVSITSQTQLKRNRIGSGDIVALGQEFPNYTIEANDPHWYVLMGPVGGPDDPIPGPQYFETDPYVSGFNLNNPDTYYVDKTIPIGSGQWVASGDMASDGAEISQSPPTRQIFTDPDTGGPQNQMWLLAEDPLNQNYMNYFNTNCWSFDGRYLCTENRVNGSSKIGRQIMIVDFQTDENLFIGEGVDPRWAKTSNTLFYSHYTSNGEENYKTTAPSGIEVKKYNVATGVTSIIAYGVENLGETNADDTLLYGVIRFRDWRDETKYPPGGRKPYPNYRDIPPLAPVESEYGFGGEKMSVRMFTTDHSENNQEPIRFGDGSGVRPLPNPNPNYDVVTTRNKIPAIGTGNKKTNLFSRSRNWNNQLDSDGSSQRNAVILLQSGHPAWSGDGEWIVIGNTLLAGRNWNEPSPSNLIRLCNNRASDPGSGGTNGRWMTTNGRMLDLRSGGSKDISKQRTRIIYPEKNSLSINQGDQSEAYDGDQKGSPDGTKMAFQSNYKIQDGKVARATQNHGQSNTDIRVDSHEGWPDSGYFSHKTEVMYYGAKTQDQGTGANPRFTDVTRKMFGTKGVGIETSKEIFSLDARLIPEDLRNPAALNAPDDLTQYYTKGRTPNWMLPKKQKPLDQIPSIYANRFPNGKEGLPGGGLTNSGPLRFQRQADVNVVVARLPDTPAIIRIPWEVSESYVGYAVFNLIPGENHREIRGYKVYKNGDPYPPVPDASTVHYSPPKGGYADDGQTIFPPKTESSNTNITISDPEDYGYVGQYTITAVEYSGLESKKTKPFSIQRIEGQPNLNWIVIPNATIPADFEWTETLFFGTTGNLLTEAEATDVNQEIATKIVNHKGEELNFYDGTDPEITEFNVCRIQEVRYQYGQIVYIWDYDHEGTVTRTQDYNYIPPTIVDGIPVPIQKPFTENYRITQRYWMKALNLSLDENNDVRAPEMTSKEEFQLINSASMIIDNPAHPESFGPDYASNGMREVKTYEVLFAPKFETAASANPPRFPGQFFAEAWWYDDQLEIEPSERGAIDPVTNLPKGEYWRYTNRRGDYTIFPACTPIRKVDKNNNFSKAVLDPNEFLPDGTTLNPYFGYMIWVSEIGEYDFSEDQDDPQEIDPEDPEP